VVRQEYDDGDRTLTQMGLSVTKVSDDLMIPLEHPYLVLSRIAKQANPTRVFQTKKVAKNRCSEMIPDDRRGF